MNTENRLQSEEYSSGKVDILSLYLPELEKLIRDFGEPSYRARQIYTWLHEKRVLSLEEMSNIPKSLKQKLSENCRIPRMELVKSRHSAQDGTCKAAFALEDGRIISYGDLLQSKELINKYQVVVKEEPAEDAFEGFEILHKESEGRVYRLVIRGKEEDVITKLNGLNPVLMDVLQVNFEELFIYELESRGAGHE